MSKTLTVWNDWFLYLLFEKSNNFQRNELAKILGGLCTRQIAEAQEKAVVYQMVENIETPEDMKKAIQSGAFRLR